MPTGQRGVVPQHAPVQTKYICQYFDCVFVVHDADIGQYHPDSGPPCSVSGISRFVLQQEFYDSHFAVFLAMVADYENQSQKLFVLYLWSDIDLCDQSSEEALSIEAVSCCDWDYSGIHHVAVKASGWQRTCILLCRFCYADCSFSRRQGGVESIAI